MTHKDFLIEYPLQVGINTRDAIEFRQLLAKAAENYPVEWKEEKISETVIHFYIRIESTGFANGYYHLGQLHMELLIRKGVQ